MAIDTHNLTGTGAAEPQPTPRRVGLWAAAHALLASLAGAIGRLFPFRRAKSRAVPVVHDDVTLTPEGAAVWEQAMDPTSPSGKPTQHHRRRLSSGDAP